MGSSTCFLASYADEEDAGKQAASEGRHATTLGISSARFYSNGATMRMVINCLANALTKRNWYQANCGEHVRSRSV